ncbi:MAG: hypothetical protein H6815_12765 [Phycisphaeraceae bacterium]|nr:hypothetical protein [Phycisphaerales bacterium]MCB9861314.1 hypothetical protein [Phycisphaeraceae bacterium]
MTPAYMYIIGLCVLGLGAVLMVWAVLIGDRAKGRVRCPGPAVHGVRRFLLVGPLRRRCWYNMEGLVPDTAHELVCPECGRHVQVHGWKPDSKTKPPRLLRRPRRRWKWASAALAVVMLGAGTFAWPMVTAKNWVTVAPNLVLILAMPIQPYTKIENQGINGFLDGPASYRHAPVINELLRRVVSNNQPPSIIEQKLLLMRLHVYFNRSEGDPLSNAIVPVRIASHLSVHSSAFSKDIAALLQATIPSYLPNANIFNRGPRRYNNDYDTPFGDDEIFFFEALKYVSRWPSTKHFEQPVCDLANGLLPELSTMATTTVFDHDVDLVFDHTHILAAPLDHALGALQTEQCRNTLLEVLNAKPIGVINSDFRASTYRALSSYGDNQSIDSMIVRSGLHGEYNRNGDRTLIVRELCRIHTQEAAQALCGILDQILRDRNKYRQVDVEILLQALLGIIAIGIPPGEENTVHTAFQTYKQVYLDTWHRENATIIDNTIQNGPSVLLEAARAELTKERRTEFRDMYLFALGPDARNLRAEIIDQIVQGNISIESWAAYQPFNPLLLALFQGDIQFARELRMVAHGIEQSNRLRAQSMRELAHTLEGIPLK